MKMKLKSKVSELRNEVKKLEKKKKELLNDIKRLEKVKVKTEKVARTIKRHEKVCPKCGTKLSLAGKVGMLIGLEMFTKKVDFDHIEIAVRCSNCGTIVKFAPEKAIIKEMGEKFKEELDEE